MNKEILKMSQEELTEKIKELLEIHQVDLILKYLYQEQRIDKAIEYIELGLADEEEAEELLDILKGGNNE